MAMDIEMRGYPLGELREKLAEFPDSTLVTFGNSMAGNPLLFTRVRERTLRNAGPNQRVVQIELTEHLPESP